MIDPDDVVRRGDVPWTLVDERVVVWAPGRAAALDPVASVLWRCLDAQSTVREVVADVSDAFGVDADRALRSVLPVMRSWHDWGVVTNDPSAPRELGRTWRRLVDPPNG